MKTSPVSLRAVIALSLVLGACRTQAQSGAVVGAGAGALAGAALARGHAGGAILGGVLGALLGSELGRQMDALDEREVSRSLESARTHEEVRWVNPDTGGAYAVTPVRTYDRAPGFPCREFRMRARVGSGEEEVYGTACRQADGSWRVVDSNQTMAP